MVETGATRLPDPLSRAEALASRLKIAVGRPMPDLPVRALDGRVTSLSALPKPGRSTAFTMVPTSSPFTRSIRITERRSPLRSSNCCHSPTGVGSAAITRAGCASNPASTTNVTTPALPGPCA